MTIGVGELANANDLLEQHNSDGTHTLDKIHFLKRFPEGMPCCNIATMSINSSGVGSITITTGSDNISDVFKNQDFFILEKADGTLAICRATADGSYSNPTLTLSVNECSDTSESNDYIKIYRTKLYCKFSGEVYPNNNCDCDYEGASAISDAVESLPDISTYYSVYIHIYDSTSYSGDVNIYKKLTYLGISGQTESGVLLSGYIKNYNTTYVYCTTFSAHGFKALRAGVFTQCYYCTASGQYAFHASPGKVYCQHCTGPSTASPAYCVDGLGSLHITVCTGDGSSGYAVLARHGGQIYYDTSSTVPGGYWLAIWGGQYWGS